MNKSRFACLSLFLIASSCGGMAIDLGSSDLASVDLFGVTRCKGLIACLDACPPLDNGCSHLCGQNTTASGIMLYKVAIDCAQEYCVSVNHCAWADAQMTMVRPVAGDPPKICDDCCLPESGQRGLHANAMQPGLRELPQRPALAFRLARFADGG